MRKYFGNLQITCSGRYSIIRLHSDGAGRRNVSCIIAPQFISKRTYYGQPPSYPPPPPPGSHTQGGHGNYYGAYPHEASGSFHNRAPPQYYASDLGTQERPLVVMSAQQKTSWTSRFWMVLILAIGISCVLSLYDELSDRFNDGMPNSSKGNGMSMRGISNIMTPTDVKPVDLESLETTFAGVRGCDEAKKELEEIVEFLKNPEKFQELGCRMPRGALLVGPPGCGKTLLAKAIAKEAGVSFFYATGSEFDEMFVGVGSRRIRELFAAAKEHSPALIFIDEIDALGGKRSKSDHSYSRMTLNQLLSEMDGFKTKEAIIVLAATNTPDTLDKALTRPGRLDTTIAVDPPDMKGRAEVLQIYLDKIKVDASVSAMQIARGTTGFTGAELSNLVNLAAIRSAVLNKTVVTKDEIEYAKDRVMMGAESKKVIPEEERRVTAFHEAAHALTAVLLKDKGSEPVHKATIVPRGNGIMGLVQQQSEKDSYSQSRNACLARLQVCMAGRIGEEIVLGPDDVTTGASSDFTQATRMARTMVRRFGFSNNIGFVDYESADTAEGAYMSDETKRKIEKEVHSLVQKAYDDTKEMMLSHRTQLEAIAENLLKYETLSGEEINKILKGETLPPRVPQPTSSHSPPKASKSGRGHTVPIA